MRDVAFEKDLVLKKRGLKQDNDKSRSMSHHVHVSEHADVLFQLLLKPLRVFFALMVMILSRFLLVVRLFVNLFAP